MKLKVINSNSEGNAYILENDQEALLIECGVRFDRIKQAINFDITKIVACIVTHEHKDHCKAVKEVMAAGIDVWATAGSHIAMGTDLNHRARVLYSGYQFEIGGFKIKSFKIEHDAAEPVGYLINHQETGNVLFLTDSYYCEYTFPALNNIIIEANYCQTLLDDRKHNGSTPGFLRDRVIESHMSIATCKDLLQANDLRLVNNIVLIHLSSGHSDAADFKNQITAATGKTVWVADAGMQIDFNRTPF